MPIAISPRASRIALDLTAATAAHAKWRSTHSASVGRRWLGTVQAWSAGSKTKRSCTRNPPRTRLKSRPALRETGSSTTRRFFFPANTACACSWYDGATTTSTNRSLIAWAVASSTTVLKATTEPNAETGSVARALRNASAALPATAIPQGVVCLMTQHAGRVGQLATAAAPASMSSRLLNDSSFPCRWRRSRMPRGSSVT